MTQTEGDRGEHSDGCKHGCEHFETEDNNDGKEIEEPKVKEVHFKTDEKVTEEKDIKDLIDNENGHDLNNKVSETPHDIDAQRDF